MSGEDTPGNREVAHRVFAAEYEDASLSHREGEEERAPTYVVTPSGAKVNRLFFVGVLTEVEPVNEEMLRARIVDPTGAFVVYAGQYQPDARTFFERAEAPEFVAVTGKARTFEPDDGDRVFSSVRPESVNAVDADTRDRWVVDAAEATLARVGAMADAIADGADEDPASAGLAPTSGIALALGHYHTTPAYLAALRDLSLDALEVVAGERDEVSPLSVDPDQDGETSLAALRDLATGDTLADAIPPTTAGGEGIEAPDEPGEPEPADETGTEQATETGSEQEAEREAEPAAATAGTESGTVESEPVTEGSADEADESADERDDDEELGDFEPGDLGESDAEAAGEADVETAGEADADASASLEADADAGAGETAAATDEMYELDEEERQEIEEEYGAEFSSGTEVAPPGEADIDTPEPEDEADEPGETDGPSEDEGIEDTEASTGEIEDAAEEDVEAAEDTDGEEEPEAETEDEIDEGAEEEPEADETAADVDLDETVIEHMRELDDGSGVARDELIASVNEATGASEDDIEDAIQDALMGGQCYEPEDDVLKPI